MLGVSPRRSGIRVYEKECMNKISLNIKNLNMTELRTNTGHSEISTNTHIVSILLRVVSQLDNAVRTLE
ncbi:hypothetical protein E2C01_072596 [Portunus trituberculatus]|uniref:Uncharacterized protein n=1 Tax=Portunus trituberculatus TaxID=210409 RepID=A0A5B7I9D2_PORTR|nr:hypothetical protein [Portunus trituberculatus]